MKLLTEKKKLRQIRYKNTDLDPIKIGEKQGS